MQRRGFISMLGAFFGALVFGGKVPEVKARVIPKPVSLFQCHVAGFPYYQGPKIFSDLQSGQKLKLLREPNNPHDSKAIAVFTSNGHKLGYIPRTHNPLPADLMDNGHKLTAGLSSVSSDMGDYSCLEMGIFVKGGGWQGL
ncbi:HIRAN domain-containing protein [Desulfonatronovibrio magnus]|uniref:HIRAN domain-containing protein n=1 Tax=Desulfonatronovibrio magnus TaxID=698827 RepID=UPI000696F9CD|nr:HIRAN domain-containing protein [Desulfonatronovibrio magnus]